ncbi:AMP-binding protein [Streptomyces sp. NPDC004539]|uniref:fatty acyl-AMP ligase n=1 Tax=Streptomyces sp. NPDC004539 TaxID=3154280 RepID=UPI0033B457C0
MTDVTARPPVAFASLPAALTHWARERPDTTAYTFIGAGLAVEHTVTYRELETSALRIAAHLRAAARPGDRVLLLFPPGIDYLAAFLGCLCAGVTAVPLYAPRPGARLDRVEAVVRDCRPALALTTEILAGKLGDTLPGGLPVHTAETALSGGPALPRPVEPGADDLAFLQYTSGSTGNPKGVMVGHRNLVANETAIAAGFGIRPDDVILSWLPLYHDMGLIGTALLPLHQGVPAVLLDTFSFVHDPLIWPLAIDRFGATCSGGPNFAYQLLIDRHDPERLAGTDLGSWRIAFNGAEPVSGRTLRDFADRYAGHGLDPRAPHPCYGLAEATLFVTGAAPGAGHRTGRFDRRGVEQGRLLPAPGTGADTVEIVSAGGAALDTAVVVRGEDGGPLPDGHVGEICVQGPGVAHGYWGDAAGEETFRARITGHEGTFLRTGDLGALLDGQLYPVGRSKDLIIVAGRNFHPHDLESVGSLASPLLRPGAAAAFQPDPGERDVVLVLETTREGVGALRADDGTAGRALVERVRREVGTECDVHLADVVLVFPGSLPKTSSGKIRRAECRRRHLDGRLRPVVRPRPSAAEPAEDGGGSPGELLGRLAAAQLGYDVGADDRRRPLAALGLDSLRLVALKSGAERVLGRPLAPGLFHGDRSLDEIAGELSEGGRAVAAFGVTAAPDDVPGSHPASEGQIQLAFGDELLPEDTANILPTAVRIARRLEPERLRAALTAAQHRHPALRTVLGPMGSGTQIVHESLPPDLTLWEHGCEDPEEIHRLLGRAAFRRFDLTAGPLVRAAAVLTPDATFLLLACHHAVADYWSLRIVLAGILGDLLGGDPGDGEGREGAGREAGGKARAEAGPGTGPASAPVPGPAGWAAEQARSRDAQAGRLAELAARWHPSRDRLLFPTPPGRRRRNPAQVLDFAVEATTTRALHDRARAHGHTPFVLLAAAYLRALHRATGHREIVIGTPHHGRGDWRYAETVGYLVNMLPLKGDFTDGDGLDALTERTRRELRTALDAADIPLARLLKALAPERQGQHPLFQATFTFQQSADDRLDDGFAIPWSGCRQTFGGVELRAVDLPPRDVAFALSLYGARHGDRLVFRLQYQRDAVPENVAAHVRDEFRTALDELTAPSPNETSGGSR